MHLNCNLDIILSKTCNYCEVDKRNIVRRGEVNMNMTAISCFIKVAELLSFTKAADALYVSQQSVSLHIKRLEEEYGSKLFERRPSLKLTDAGVMLLQAAQDIIAREKELRDQLALNDSEACGTITIGLPPNRSSYFANVFVPHFSEMYPKMCISLVEKVTTLLPMAVQRNEVDLALVLLAQEDTLINPNLYNSIHLDTEDLCLVVSDTLLRRYFGESFRDSIDSFKQGIKLEDFACMPMFLRPESSQLHYAIVEHLLAKGKKPYIRVRTTTTSMLIPLCAAGYGIFFCPPRLLNHLKEVQEAFFKELHSFPILEFNNKRQLTLIYHARKYLTQPLRKSIEIIKDYYAVPCEI